MLAARSRHVPVSDACFLLGPRYLMGGTHVSTPETASLPLNDTVTGRLYQPFLSGLRAALASTLGGVASYLIGNAALPVFPALSMQFPVTDVSAASGPL